MRTLRLLGLLLFGVITMALPSASNAQIAVGVSIRVGPPALPVYAQPICPGPGYMWTPGYWAYGDDGYYWVPGTWVVAPAVGLLWTPGYWGFSEGLYVWHAGYWGPHVGFYGGINYGFGYTGVGFFGGEWRGREFAYNRSVTNVNVTVIHNYYNRTVINNTTVNRVSYNGGPEGIRARATERELAADREHHFEASRLQMEHEHAARGDRRLWASENHGRPVVAASARPGAFHGRDVVSAREERGNRPDRRDNGAPIRAGRPESHEVRAGRNDRPSDVEHRDNGRHEAFGHDNSHNPHSSAPTESHGNPHVTRDSAPRGNAGHDNGSHGNNKPDHGNQDHGNKEHGKP